MIAKIRAIKMLSLTVACLLLCSGLLVWYTPGTSGGEPEEAVYQITDISVSEVAAVAITNEKTRFGLMAKGEEIEVVSDVQGNYSLTELRSLIYAVSHLSGSRKITDLSDGDQYGMNKPLASISVIKTDGTQLELSLLAENPLDGNYYLFSQEDQAIYLISANVAAMFLRQEADFFSHTVLPRIDGGTYQEMEWIEMDFHGNGRDYRIAQKNGSFYLEKPILQKLNSAMVLQDLLLPTSALYSDNFVASGANLAEYGFDDYTLRIEMKYGGQQYAALLLDSGDGKCLMADEKSGDVYQLSSDSLTALLEDYTSLLGGKAFSYAAGDLKSVAVTEGEGSVLVEMPEEKPEAGLLSLLNDAEIAAEVNDTAVADGQPDEAIDGTVQSQTAAAAMSVTFTLKSGSIDVVELVPAPQGGYFVRINGTVNFTTTERYYQTVKKALQDFK